MEPKKEVSIKDEALLDTRKMAIFENDSDFYVVYKKAEKLATATYMITNFFTTEEPLKWALRNIATEILKDTISLGTVSLSFRESLVRSLVAKVMHQISLYEVAHKAGFISPPNWSIIKTELEKMIDLLNKREGSQVGTKSISFDSSFFGVDVPQAPISRTSSWHPNDTQTRDQKEAFSQTSHTTHSYVHKTDASKTVSFIKDNQKDIKDKRQDVIIALVKKHRNLTIKGFTGVIKNCSEKTIQRELLALVSKGVLKKEGERRWSSYSLA